MWILNADRMVLPVPTRNQQLLRDSTASQQSLPRKTEKRQVVGGVHPPLSQEVKSDVRSLEQGHGKPVGSSGVRSPRYFSG
jgi:hypothetical protein